MRVENANTLHTWCGLYIGDLDSGTCGERGRQAAYTIPEVFLSLLT